jgi:hypothetical protein
MDCHGLSTPIERTEELKVLEIGRAKFRAILLSFCKLAFLS